MRAFVTTVIVSVLLICSAQAQNTFPTGAGTFAGVGTTAPATAFHVYSNTTNLSNSNFITIENRGVNASYTTSHVLGGLLFAGYRDIRAPANVAGIWAVRTSANGGLNSFGDLVFATTNNAQNITLDNALPAERMRILANGNVGIGTPNPTSLLQVGSPAFNSSTNVAEQLIIAKGTPLGNTAGLYSYLSEYQQTGTANVNRLQTALYRRIDGTAWQGMEYRLQYAVDNSFTDGSKAFISIGGSDPTSSGGGFISLGTGGSDRLSVTNKGNVGIGTINPGGKLQVSDGGDDPIKYGSLQIVRAAAPTDNKFHLAFIRNGQNVAGMGYVNNSTTLGIWSASMDNSVTPTISFLANNTVGIGTSDTKGYLLAVAGSAIATKVVVKQQANWPDYVFEPTYTLPSLQSVESFIAINKHLPEVPSAETVNKDGVDLGNNQAVLLKKIEELTLYLIEQNKKIEALTKRLSEEEKAKDDMQYKIQLLQKNK